MFQKEVYVARRQKLCSGMSKIFNARGIVIFIGAEESPINYPSNAYKFRQDSSFLYYWGLNDPSLCAILDLESGSQTIYGDDVTLDDIIWMGPQTSVAEKAAGVGVGTVAPRCQFDDDVLKAVNAGRQIHFLKPYQASVQVIIAALVPGVEPSLALTKQVISQRLVKEECEIEEIRKAAAVGYEMHMTGFEAMQEGVSEAAIAAKMYEVTLRHGWGTSFNTICSQHGETLHNVTYDGIITPGKLLLVDAGAEINSGYCSDFTRTYPCSSAFTAQQKEIYDIVVGCNNFAMSLARPGITYSEVHTQTMYRMLEDLKALGLVHGDIQEMFQAGIAGLFMPHGLGHNMGLDVHDMEGLGEDLVGYDEDQKRSTIPGLRSLRMARKLVPGHVITDEPGIYFIPDLIEKYRADGIGLNMVNYEKLKTYYNFGGIRIEDDLLITNDGCRIVGDQRLPLL